MGHYQTTPSACWGTVLGMTETPARARVSAARERILEAASALFYAHGIRAVGVDRLIAESAVAKATFYKHFPTKEDLVLAYLERVDEAWSAQLKAAARAAGPAPADQLVGMFDALASVCRREGYRGCGLINAAAENASGTPIHGRVMIHKDAVRTWITSLAEEAGAQDPRGLSRALTLLLDGGLTAGSLDGEPDAAATAKAAARTLLDQATRVSNRAD